MPDLQNLRLFLLHRAGNPPQWFNIWARSYPTVWVGEIAHDENTTQWQAKIHHYLQQFSENERLMIVAHDVAANAVAAWYYATDWATQKRVAGVILVAPLAEKMPDDAAHTFERVRFNAPTAVITGRDDVLCPEWWAQQRAKLWGARWFATPHHGYLHDDLGGWEWGMQLMQEMLD